MTTQLRQSLHARIGRRVDAMAEACTVDITMTLGCYARLPELEIARLRDTTALIIRGAVRQAGEGIPFPDSEAIELLGSTAALRARQGVPYSAFRSTYDISWFTCLRAIMSDTSDDDRASLRSLLGTVEQGLSRVREAETSAYYAELVNSTNAGALAQALINGAPGVAEMASRLGTALHERYCVLVIRTTRPDAGSVLSAVDGLLVAQDGHRLVVLLGVHPGEEGRGGMPEPVADAWRLAQRRMPDATGGWGWAGGPDRLPVDYQRVARAASVGIPGAQWPVDVADAAIDLAVCDDPAISQAVRGRLAPLAGHPELVRTLDAFYAADMNRGRAAAALHVHRNTLDNRLRRVGELTGLTPASVSGVRLLTSALSVRRFDDLGDPT